MLASHEFVKFLMVLIVMLPLSLYRNIDKLGKVSHCATNCYTQYLINLVVCRCQLSQ